MLVGLGEGEFLVENGSGGLANGLSLGFGDALLSLHEVDFYVGG